MPVPGTPLEIWQKIAGLYTPPQPKVGQPAASGAARPADFDARVRRYLETVPPAVSGQGGHDITFYAANRLVRGFGLDPEAAFQYLAEWNLKCQPPWSEKDLRHKLAQAQKQPGPRGFLLLADPGRAKHPGKVSHAPTAVTNYYWDEVGDGDAVKKVRRGRPSRDILEDILRGTGGWPRRVGTTMLFAPTGPETVCWMDEPAALFAFIESRFATVGRSGVDWAGGSDCPPKHEFFEFCLNNCDVHDTVESFPHHPPFDAAYYHHPEVPPATGGAALAGLLDFFCPASPEDADLIRSFFLTLFWGGPPGKRPIFVFDGDDEKGRSRRGGRGAGKSTVCQIAGDLLRQMLTFDPSEHERDIKIRLLTPGARTCRLILIDNIKTLRLSSGALEGLITSNVISGRQLHVGDGARPNMLTWALTFNSPAMSKDFAQRSVLIKVKAPVYSPEWHPAVTEYLRARRWEIVADCLAELARPSVAPEGFAYSRWPDWERDVLLKLPDPVVLQSILCDRRRVVDDDDDMAEEIAAAFAEAITTHTLGRIDPKKARVLVPNDVVLEKVVKRFKRDLTSATHASRWLTTFVIPELEKYPERTPYRGWVWTGELASEDDSLKTWADL